MRDRLWVAGYHLGRFFRTPLGTAVSIAIVIAILAAMTYVYAKSPSCSDAPDPAYCDELQHAPRVGQ